MSYFRFSIPELRQMSISVYKADTKELRNEVKECYPEVTVDEISLA